MFSGGGSSGGGGRDTRNHRLLHLARGSTYNPNQQQQQQHSMSMNMNMNMNMLLHPQQQQQQALPMSPYQQQLLSPTATSLSSGACGGGGGGGGGDDDDFPKRDERVVQWGNQETRDFIAVRGELEAEFSVAKRKKGLWELVVTKMKQLGYSRTPDQCKCKWKNLLVRYKGKEVSDPDNGQQYPFNEEMQEIFMRSYHMPPLVYVPETNSEHSGKKRVRKADTDESFRQFITDSSDEDKVLPQNTKIHEGKQVRTSRTPKDEPNSSSLTAIQGILQNFFRQQQRIDMEWNETMEKSAKERDKFEMDWHRMKEKVEKERMMHEEEWREREEQRKAREEIRAEKRGALLTILLKKLVEEYDH